MASIVNSETQVVILGAVKPDGSPDLANVLHRFPVPEGGMRIRLGTQVDEVGEVGGGKIKQPTGYADTTIEISLWLSNDEPQAGVISKTALEKFAELMAAFRERGSAVTRGDGKVSRSGDTPLIYSIQSPLTDVCGIKTVLLSDLQPTTSEGSRDLDVMLTLIEFEPVATQVSKRRKEAVARQQAAAESDKSAKEQADEDAHDVEAGQENPLVAAFRSGKAAAMGGPP